MNRMTYWFAGAIVVLSLSVSLATAADKYWDINGTNAGATDDAGGVATGAWDTTSNLWNTDPTGVAATGVFATGDKAIFSAGTNATGQSTITASVLTASGIVIEEGEIILGGSNAVTVSPGGTVEIKAGATLSTNSSSRIAAAASSATVQTVKYQLDGPTAILKTTNSGFAGSFIDVDAQIVLNGGGKFVYDSTTPQINIIQAPTGTNTATITGTGPLIVDAGQNALAFAGNCTYTGGTQIIGGELRIRTSNDRLPVTTDVTVSSPGVLNLNGLNQKIGSLTGNGDVGTGAGTLTIEGSTSTTFDGALKNLANFNVPPALATTSGNGRLIKNGTGVITFNGQNDLNGSITLNGAADGSTGGIIVGSSGSLCGDIADITVNGGTLTLNNSAETVENFGGTGGKVVLNTTALTIDPTSTAATPYAGVISGSGSITKNNTIAGSLPSTLTLSGANTYSGGTTINGGRVHITNTTGSGTGTGAVAVNSGILDGSGRVTGAVTVASNAHLGGGIGAATGATLTLDGAVSLQGGSFLEATVGAAGIAAASGDYNNNGVVDAADYVLWRKNPAGFGGDPAGYNTWRGNFGGVSGSGIGTSDRVKSTLNNGVTIDPGTIFTLNGGGTSQPSGVYTVLEYAGSLSGFSNLTLNNATGMELSSGLVNNTVDHRVEVTVSNTVQNRSWVAAGDGNWSIADAANWSPSGQPNGPGAIVNFAGSGAHTVTITDSDKTAGTITLNNASGYDIASASGYRLITNTYTGDAAINVTAGNHTISALSTIAKNTAATISNAANTLTVSGDMNINSGATLQKLGAGTLTVSGVVRGAGAIKASAAVTNLNNGNAYTGGTTIDAGATVNANNTGTTSATGTGAVTVNGTLNVNSGARITSATTVGSGGVLNVLGTTTGTTTTQASGTTNYNGGTSSSAQTISGGKVTVGSSAILTGTSTISANGTLTGTGTVRGITVQSTGHLQPGGVGAIGQFISDGTVTLNNGSVFNFDVSSAGSPGVDYDYFAMTSTTANSLVVAAPTGGNGATVVVNQIGANDINGSYTLIDYSSTTAALATSFTSVTGPAGHTYAISLDTVNTQVVLTIAAAGLGSGAAVPEPATVGLLTIAVAALAAGRRGRRR